MKLKRQKNNIVLNTCVIVGLMLSITLIIMLAFKVDFSENLGGIIGSLSDDISMWFFGGETNNITMILSNFFSINMYILILILLFLFALILLKSSYAILMRAFGRWRV